MFYYHKSKLLAKVTIMLSSTYNIPHIIFTNSFIHCCDINAINTVTDKMEYLHLATEGFSRIHFY